MPRSRPTLPAGHGELLLRPEPGLWGELLHKNRRAVLDWTFEVAGRSAAVVRTRARQEAIAAAEGFSATLGVEVRTPLPPTSPIVMTGHQPELYHPGVWVKNFLLQRLADQETATPLNVTVDTDGFDSVSITAPCLSPTVRRCTQHLAIGTPGNCFACTSVPSRADLEDFCRAGDEMLSTLPAPSIRRHFGEFCDALRDSERTAGNLGELMVKSRRRYEADAGSDYLELPLTALVRGEAFATFMADIALRAGEFAELYNAELRAYRAATGTRSQAQPFPDLEIQNGRVELPFWATGGGRRQPVWAERSGSDTRLVSAEGLLAQLPADGDGAISAVLGAGMFAPKALALTLFTRLFCSDLFIHGVGGGRYDRVTDGVCRRYYGVEPPDFVVASITMYLPLGGHVVTDGEVAAAKERLNRIEHNPDALLGEVEFESEDGRIEAYKLSSEKAELVRAIAVPDADKKALGKRIREVNAQLAAILEPVRVEYEAELGSLQAQMEATEVLTDRTYPFCYWSPREIADKVW